MATKLTRIRNNDAFKIFILVLSVISLFLCIYIGEKIVSFYRENYSVNDVIANRFSDSVLGNGNSEYAKQIRNDTGKLYDLCETYISDEAVEDGSAFKTNEAALLDEMEAEIQTEIYAEKISVIDTMYVYDYDHERYTYPGVNKSVYLNDFSSEDQIRAEQFENMTTFNGSSYFAITYINGREYYKGYPLDVVDVGEDAIRASYEESYSRTIASTRATFKYDYENLKSHFSELKNYNFFIQNKENGLVYTNITGAKSIEDAIKKYDTKTTDYIAYLDGGNFYYSNGLRTLFSDEKSCPCYTDTDGNLVYLFKENYYDYCFGNFNMDKYDIFIHVVTDSSVSDADDYYTLYTEWGEESANLRRNIAIFCISLLVWIMTLVVSAYTAGHVDENGNTILVAIDKVPNSIHLIVSLLLIFGIAFVPFFVYLEATSYELSPSIWVSVIASLSSMALIELLTSISRQAKNHTYFKNTLVYILVIKNYRKIKHWVTSGVDKLVNGSIKKRILLVFNLYIVAILAISVWTFVYYNSRYSENFTLVGIVLIILLTIVALIYVRKVSGGLDRILSALSKVESGDLNYTVDEVDMPKAVKPLATKANNLTAGLNKALDEAVRSERMKTELITNVSHDLKTPLTSIITYTDLLKHCNIEDEKALEFIDVLDEKSARLKVLIDDLVEASKASSGNLTLNLTKIDLNELTEQIFGEYEDALEEQNLDLRYIIPNEPTYVVADGQKTYRVIDNLFSNIKKYAMPGTRVYLDLKKDSGFAIIEMKNVSKEEMHFDIERLCDRFVRGDESRNSEIEGSGLGLSIAKNLTEAQDGIFELSVDGDLFKVTIKLPLNKEIIPRMVESEETACEPLNDEQGISATAETV